MDPLVVFVLIAMAISLGGYLLLERQRTEALRKVASKFKLEFDKKAELPGHIDHLDFHLFSQGANTIKNVMSGPLYGMQTMVRHEGAKECL